MDEKRTQEAQENGEMTLKGYYQSLPDASYPKTDFVNEIASEAKVSAATVRNWVVYGMKPKNKKHIEILVKHTGIPAEKLWKD